MTTQGLDKILDAYLEELDGQPGFWRGNRGDVPVFVYSDDANDRMRIMAPIGMVVELEPALLHELLKANYDRALDARYAMRGMEIWSVVVHPLATLATDDLPNLLDQCVALVKNTGSTFASSELVFRTPPGEEDIVLEFEDDEEEGEANGEGNEGNAGDEEEDEDDDEGSPPRR